MHTGTVTQTPNGALGPASLLTDPSLVDTDPNLSQLVRDARAAWALPGHPGWEQGGGTTDDFLLTKMLHGVGQVVAVAAVGEMGSGIQGAGGQSGLTIAGLNGRWCGVVWVCCVSVVVLYCVVCDL